MEATDLLLIGTEVSVAFAGFAGIIATFQFRDETKINRGRIVGLTMIVQFSLMCSLFCVFPLLLSHFDLEDATLWSIVSCFGLVYICYSMYFINKNMRGAVRKKSARLLFGLFYGAAALVSLSLVLNIADLAFHKEPGPYLTAIVFGLSLVGYMFARLLLRPLWRVVHEQETANSGAAA